MNHIPTGVVYFHGEIIYVVQLPQSGKLIPSQYCTSRFAMATKKTAAPDAEPAALAGYRADHQKDVVNRLRRIEGQVRGLVEMIQSGRSCEDVATQMSAARKAMDKTFYRMMACSVMEAVYEAKTDAEAIVEVERSARLLEKFG